jgi:tetratricopeptide (TPR) repeat protein
MRILLLLAFEFLLVAGAFAQSTPDTETCDSTSGTADDRVAACTRAITSGQLSTENLAKTFSNRGVEWQAKGNYDRAIADYGEAIRLNPRHANAYSNRGIAWSAKGDNDRAIADYGEAIRLNPQYAYAYRNRGLAWRAKGDYDRAIADYGEAIRLNPQFASAYNSLAWLLATSQDAKVRDGKRAVQLAQKAGALDSWHNANYLGTLAAAYAESGQFADAVHSQEKALGFPDYEKTSGTAARERLSLYRSGKPYRE